LSFSKEKDKMEGQKFSADKTPLYTVFFKQFPDALVEVAKCSQAGHLKYPNDVDWMNFKRVPNAIESYRNACVRHLMESGVNDDMEKFGTVLHQAQAIWNLLAALEIELANESK
jgi:hypothetical protein